MSDNKEKRRFEFKSDRSYKFWEVSVDGIRVTARYGRIGTPGRDSIKTFETCDDANDHVAKQVAKKKKSGYKEVIKEKIHRKTMEELWEELQPHEPFLKTILESPDDVGGYFVYADWLMEQGDPRGQFIHSQLACEDPQTPMWEQTKQEKLAKSIQRKHWRDWLGELSRQFQGPENVVRFRRGLLSELHIGCLTIPLAHALKKSPFCRLLRELKIYSTPIVHATVEIVGLKYDEDVNYDVQPLMGADLGNLIAFEFWGQISDDDGISFETQTEEMGTRKFGYSVFELIRTMPKLQRLKLNTSFKSDSFAYLFQSNLPELTELEIEDSIGDQPIEELCRSNWMGQLKWLTLHNCDLSDSSCELIADTLDPNTMEQLTIFRSWSRYGTR